MSNKIKGYDPIQEYRWNLLGWGYLGLSLITIFIGAIFELSLTPLWILLGGAAIVSFLISLKPEKPNS